MIRQGIGTLSNQSIISVPLSLEYEKLYDWLEERRAKKYNIQDMRLRKKDESKIVSPGISNVISNQSSINFEEPNTKMEYPTPLVPYSQGVIWE